MNKEKYFKMNIIKLPEINTTIEDFKQIIDSYDIKEKNNQIYC
jgi:hypothetical protein